MKRYMLPNEQHISCYKTNNPTINILSQVIYVGDIPIATIQVMPFEGSCNSTRCGKVSPM